MRKYAVIDLETTGPKYESGDRIFQFGCTLIDGDEVIEYVSLNINPEKSIPFEIQLLTGVTNADVATAPYFDEVAMTIFNLLEDRTLVAHNVGFDGPFIMSALKDALGLELEVPLIDTVQLAQICYPTALSYRLSDLTETLEIRHTQVHTAGSDARATAELFLKMKTKFRELSTITLKQLTEFSGELLGDTGTIFEEILEEKGKEEKQEFPLEQGFVVSPLTVKEVELKSSKRKTNALEAYQKLVDSGFLEDKVSQREMITTIESLIETDEPLHFIEAALVQGKHTLTYWQHLKKRVRENQSG
jgi:exonuclease, DNA polymerase III, epsilon subunit family